MSEHPGLGFAPPIAALPFFAFDGHSSVIYNLYAREQYTSAQQVRFSRVRFEIRQKIAGTKFKGIDSE